MLITSFFTENGIPKTGLSPTIRIRDLSDNSLVITDAVLTEVGDGYYSYEFVEYDDTKDYAIRTDGGASLNNYERYQSATNEVGGLAEQATLVTVGTNVSTILNIEKGKWKITGNQLILYAEDGIAELYKFNLFDANGVPSSDTVFERRPV
jgi:hypothetical protein